MNFYISTLHTEFYKDFYDLIKIFVSENLVLDLNQKKVDYYDVECIEEMKNNGTEYEITYTVHFNGKAYATQLEENIIADSLLSFKKTYKKLIKKCFYNILKLFSKTRSPWGSLTGVRPTYLIYEQLNKGLSLKDSVSQIEKEFDLQNDKAELLYNTVHSQLSLMNVNIKAVDIYIGIPFCPTRCSYCSFASNVIDTTKIDMYLTSLYKEIEAIQTIIDLCNFSVRAIYVGGGTPTSLTEKQLEQLLIKIKNCFLLNNAIEFTVEAGRVDSISIEKLKLLKQYRVNRISINPQTMNNETLKIINRNHTSEDCIRIFKIARKLGFDNINMDIILGLPNEQLINLKNTLDIIYALKPDGLTVHTLALKKKSNLVASNYCNDSNNNITQMLELVKSYVAKLNMHPYYLYRQKSMAGNHENVSYCLKGKECLYNIDMMEETTSILAAGAGTISKKVFGNIHSKILRLANVSNLDIYNNTIDNIVSEKIHFFCYGVIYG